MCFAENLNDLPQPLRLGKKRQVKSIYKTTQNILTQYHANHVIKKKRCNLRNQRVIRKSCTYQEISRSGNFFPCTKQNRTVYSEIDLFKFLYLIHKKLRTPGMQGGPTTEF